MPVTITITGENAGHALYEVRQFAGGLIPPNDVAEAVRAMSGASSDKRPGNDQADDAKAGLMLGRESSAEALAPKRTRKIKTETTPVEPPPPPPATDAETAAQDKADEAAESAKPADAPLTLDDVRNAAVPYINKFGKDAATFDLIPIIEKAAGKKKISDLDPSDQKMLKAAVDAFIEAGKSDKRIQAATA